MFVLDKPTPPYRSVAEIAAEPNKDPVDVIIDLALEKQPEAILPADPRQREPGPRAGDDAASALRVTFSDSGAHVSQIMDSSLQSHVLSYWVREKQAMTLEEAIRMLTFVPASHWGLHGRGLLREG